MKINQIKINQIKKSRISGKILPVCLLLPGLLMAALLMGGAAAGSKADPLVTRGWVEQYVAAEFNRLELRLDAVAEAVAQTHTLRLWLDRDYLEVDGERRPLDAPAYLGASGRTYVPLRALGEAIGAELEWDNTEKRATYIKAGRRVSLLVGRSIVQVNGQELATDSAPEVKNGRVMVPLRVVTENLGFRLTWDNQQKMAELII